ncbi:MAG: ABC transporter ATP-binding protein [Ignavibacteriales bacterium]|nr:ABC transporter ATP-binding protein [Ignavibacteriales bacterium]
MDKDFAIKVENVSKKYCKSLKRSMLYGVKDIARNTFGLSSHSDKLRKNEFWALDDISFEVKKGETLGIIGPNGSGKTTLLKLLNGIFWPDIGKIAIKGKVGALIEVGAGFHPLLTGRENIYINAAILGMTKEETDRKFDAIVEFADIGDFLDVPVKHYSSGMFVRLGFAVAVHCEPDILLVDEVLAVGDSVFQTRCYRKINEIKKRDNVAIVLVSHSLLTVEKFCDNGLFLNYGKIKSYGEIHKVIRDYQSAINQLLDEQKSVVGAIPGVPYCTKEVEIIYVKYLGKDNKERKEFSPGDALGIRIKYKTNNTVFNPIFQIAILNQEDLCISVFGTHIDKTKIKSIQGEGIIECWIDNLPLLLNKYFITVAVYDKTHNITFDYWNGAILNKYIQILPNRTSEKMAEYTPICYLNNEWTFYKEENND